MLSNFLHALILIQLFFDNNEIVKATGYENDDADVPYINAVYKSILFSDMEDFNDAERMKIAQKEIACFFYKKFCWSILTNYEHMEEETDEFREHFQKIQREYQIISERKVMPDAKLDAKICDFYKMFVRIIFDNVLEKSEHWRQYLRFRTRHLFWLDNQWKIKMEEFLQNMYWKLKEQSMEMECENLKEYLAKNSQSYVANYWSLKWLLDNSLDFQKTIEKQTEEKFMEMKRRIFVLTGHIHFDRLELARMNVLKIGSPIFELTQICLKRYLIGMEDSRKYQLRMSISLLMYNFMKFTQNLIAKEKRSIESNKDPYYVGKVREFTQKNLEKFDQIIDKINGILSSIADLNDVDIGQEEAKMEQTLCILLKLFEIDKYGRPTFKDKSFLGMSEDELFNNTNLDLEMLEEKRKQILTRRYLGVVEEQLEKADTEMQNILKNKPGSIYRLALLIGGTDNLVEIWEKYKEKIRSIDFFSFDFDKRIRIDYEILFTNDSEESQLLSRTNLNIFLLMNTVEKILDKNIKFSTLLEDWRSMFRLKYDFIHVKPESLTKTNIEVTYKANIILEFVEKWANKKSKAEKILNEFKKVKERENKELSAMRDKLEKEKSLKNEEFDEWLKNQNAASLSSRFQNIHIEQLIKLAEEDLHKKNTNEAKTFDFWLFLKQFLLNRDKKIITRLRIILNDNGILKLMKKIGKYYSKLPKIEEQKSTGKKSTKGKKKKKTTAAGQPAHEEEELLQSDVITESSNKDEKVSSEESVLGKDLNVQQNLPNIQQILERITSAFAADKSNSLRNDVEMGGNLTIANSPTVESSSANVPPILNEMYQYALTEADLESVLNTNEKLRIPVIDAYLEILTRDNAKHFGLIPSYVIHYFRAEQKFPPDWLQNKIDQQGIVDNVKYWLIPAHLNADHWVLTVMDVDERRLHYFDSFSPGSTNEQFTIDILIMLPRLYKLMGQYHKGQQFISYNLPTTSRNDLPIQRNAIDCGVFMLMFAWDIFEQNSLNAEMHITQKGVKEARKQIYRQLAYGFGIEIDENMLENLNFLPSSPELTPPTSPAKSISTSLKQKSQNEVEQATSNILPYSKLERLRSIHEIPKEEPNDHELYLLKSKYDLFLIFANDKDPKNLQILVDFVITLHFKKLTKSILMEYEQNHMANADEIFGIELYTKFAEYVELIKLEADENIEPYACNFFKFFMQLRRNKILTMNEDWNKYVRFRMRHFYWIDPEWDANENILLKNITMEQNGKCNNAEIKEFSKKFANVRTYSNISHYWTLKWLLQNSPEFIEKFNKISGEKLLILKKRIFDLIGENAFEKLEMAIPALKFNACINEMTRINITRYFSGGLEGMKYEFRHSLAYLLNHFFHFREKCIESGLNEYIQKMDEIYEQIVGVKVVKLVDEEHTLEEEVNELKEAICIFLKFFEITEEFSDEKFFSFNYEEVLQCTANEFETIWERQHHNLLETYNNNSIEKILSADDKDFENILKHKEGAIYRLKLFTGYDNFLKLMDNYDENIRDKKYFTNTLSQIRQSFEIFMSTKDEYIRQLNRTKLKIYILMRWNYHTLQNKRIFDKFLWKLDAKFRLALDELIVDSKNLNKIEIDCTLRGERIIEFVKKWIKKAKDEEQIREEYISEQNDCDNLIARYKKVWNDAVPSLQYEFQLIHLLTLEELANQDKKIIKTKTEDMEKRKEINFWEYFNDLHNFPDRIARISELLNINSLKHLYELLGINIFEGQLGELSKSKIEIEAEEGNTLQKKLPPSNNQQEGRLSKLAKKKSKISKTSTDEEGKIEIKESEQQKMENVKEIPLEKKLEGKQSPKKIMGKQSHLYEGEQKASNKLRQSQFTPLPSKNMRPRQFSVRKLKKDEENKEEEKLRKDMFQSLSSQKLNSEQIYFNTGFFHYKHLSWSILFDFDKSKFDAKQLVQYDERKKEHVNLLIQSSDLFEKEACRFYKFFIRLKNDNILTKNEEWNAYYKFRMRHFYWIDTQWEKNNVGILTKLKLNELNCTSNEYEHFTSFYTSPPQSQISNYWCLKWLLNNSQKFINEINNLNRQNLMNFKQNIYELIGHDGFYYLELIAPKVIKKEKPLTTFTIECIKRVLNNERPKRNELRMALNYLLNTALSFRDKLTELKEDAIDEDRNFFNDNIVKFDNIYAEISKKLISLVDEEQSQEEEETILSHAVCIALKFYEINEAKWEVIMITIENFVVKTYEKFVDCSEEEIEKIIYRQRIVSFKNNYAIIENQLVNDMEMQSILQFTPGSICKLNELIGGSKNLNTLWHLHTNLIRSKTYFSHQNMEIFLRDCYHIFLYSTNPYDRYAYKICLNIYAFMKSIESMVDQDESFNILIENWRCNFRYWLDNLYLHPKLAKNVGMEVAIMPAKIIAFIKKTKNQGKQKDPKQLAHDFKNEELDEEKEFLKRIKQNLPEPMLSEDLQKIHVENLQTFAIEDRDKSEKDSTNIWHFFHELHNLPEQIAQISQILDKGNIRILYQKLGLKFHEEKFPESRIEELTKDEKIDTSKKGNKKKAGKKEQQSTPSPAGKSSQKKQISDSTSENSPKGKTPLEGKESTKEEEGKSPKEKKLKESTKEEGGKSPKEKKLKESTKEEGGKSPKEKKLKESTKEEGGKSPKGKTEGISSPNEKSHKIMEECSGINKNKEEEKQRESQSFEKIEKLNILNDYKFEDLMQMDTLNLHYKELMKDTNNEEKRRLADITVFAVEIGQRLKALEISTKLWTDKMNLENIRQEVNNFRINKFKDMDELEEALYNLLKRIEFAMENPINMEKNEINKENIFKMRKQLHKMRLSWIIRQNGSNWQNLETKDLNNILLALNLESETKFNEEIKIWETILGQIKLDHELYSEREIKGRGGMEVIDFAKYSQQLCFGDDQNKKEEELTERLIEEFEFVDVKEIERIKPIKYLWMEKYMETKERVKKLVKEWHTTAEILFTGSNLLGTMTSRSDMDTIVVTYDVQIYEYNQEAECIIEEKFDEQKKFIQRIRKCENDQLFICKLCKISHVILAIRIPGSLELVKAFFCEDDNYESKSFNECIYKVKVDFLFATLQNEKHLEILTRNKSHEIDEILVKLSKFDRPSYFALTGLRDNLRILEQFPTDGKNFRIACAALKLWAKRNNIYGPKLGFLKGVHMNLLMAKIYLRYPTASVPFLIEQFFATYILWPWPMPVQLLPISELTYEESRKLDFRGNPQDYLLWFIKDPNAEMPIISPGYIESNKASDVDRYTKSIMRTFMSEGLKQIREIRAGKVKSTGGNEWHDFMRGNDLAQRYAHYLVVTCLTKVIEGTFGDDFCAITSLKMHDFIPTDIGKLLPKEIRWYHIIEAGSRKECFINRNGYEDISKYKCDIWLVGLQLKKDKQIDPEEMINLENTKEMNEAKEKIYNDYYEYKKRFNKTIGEKHKNTLKGNLLLSINYVSVNDLHKWNIMLRGWEIYVKN